PCPGGLILLLVDFLEVQRGPFGVVQRGEDGDKAEYLMMIACRCVTGLPRRVPVELVKPLAQAIQRKQPSQKPGRVQQTRIEDVEGAHHLPEGVRICMSLSAGAAVVAHPPGTWFLHTL